MGHLKYLQFTTDQRLEKLVQKTASSSLVSGFLYQFFHRMDIRCFLASFFGPEDGPSERLLHGVRSAMGGLLSLAAQAGMVCRAARP